MDVKRRRTLVGEKGGRYMDRKEERALEGETRTLVVLNSRYMDEQRKGNNCRYMDEQKSVGVVGIWMNRKRVRVVGTWMNRKRVEAEKGGGGGCMGRKNPNVKTGEWGSGLSHCTVSSSSVTQINKASEEEDEGPEPLAALAAAAASSLYCYITQHH
jgi:hypothetical protein